MPEFYQTEGIDAVLDNVVHKAGATAVATSPYVMAPADGWVERIRASGVGYGRSVYLHTNDGRLIQLGHLDAFVAEQFQCRSNSAARRVVLLGE